MPTRSLVAVGEPAAHQETQVPLAGRLVLQALVGTAVLASEAASAVPRGSHTAEEMAAPSWAVVAAKAVQRAAASHHHPTRAYQNPTRFAVPTTSARHWVHATPGQGTTARPTPAAADRVHGPHHGPRLGHSPQEHLLDQLG